MHHLACPARCRASKYNVECKIEFVLVVELQPLNEYIFLFHAVDKLVAGSCCSISSSVRCTANSCSCSLLAMIVRGTQSCPSTAIMPCGVELLAQKMLSPSEDFLVFADAHTERPAHDGSNSGGVRHYLDGLALQLPWNTDKVTQYGVASCRNIAAIF